MNTLESVMAEFEASLSFRPYLAAARAGGANTYLVRLENSLGPYGSIISTYRIQAGSDIEARDSAVASAEKARVRICSVVSCERMV